MKATHFLNEATETQAQRAADHNYGEQGERTAAHIARIFNAITGRNLKERDIWAMLLALKLARNEAAPGCEDTLIDLVSYASLLAECDYAAEVKRQEDAEKDNQENIDRAQLQSLGGVRFGHVDLGGKFLSHESAGTVPTETAVAAYQAQQDDGWKNWDGKHSDGPISMAVLFDIKTRQGIQLNSVRRGDIYWPWNPSQRNTNDVVAWRPAK